MDAKHMCNPTRRLKHLALALPAVALSTVLCGNAAYGQQHPEIFVASASEDAEGVTEAAMTQALLQVLEKHAVDGITRKATAALLAQGVNVPFPPLQPSSTYTTIGGRKLALVKLRNAYANQVVIHGIVGKEFRRVICGRTRDFAEDLPVFYGPCGDTVRATFNLKGLPEAPKVIGAAVFRVGAGAA